MKICLECQTENAAEAKFCHECSHPLGGSISATENTVRDSKVLGSIFQAGGNIVYNSHPKEPKPAQYDAKWSWKSPLTQTKLAWAGVILGILSLIEGYQGFAPFVTAFSNGRSMLQLGGIDTPTNIYWIYALLGTLALLSISLWLWDIARKQTQHLSRFSLLPTLTGWGNRIGLARFIGKCSLCGGRLRFYNKPMEWTVNLKTGGREKVLKRQMVMECIRNDQHCWVIDPAEQKV